MTLSIGIRSLAVAFPDEIRTNDYYREHRPQLIARAALNDAAGGAHRIWSPDEADMNDENIDPWTRDMLQYRSDPFRGSVERRVLGPDESSLSLAVRAAKDALDKAGLAAQDIDTLIVTSMWPENLLPGDAAPLARELGLRCSAWNLESTCSSPLVGMDLAASMVRAGSHRNVLLVNVCSFSRFVNEESDPGAMIFGDGACGFVVSSTEEGYGILGSHIDNTADTCGFLFMKLALDSQGKPRSFLGSAKGSNRAVGAAISRAARPCCERAAKAAGVTLDEINFFVFNTPQAWSARLYSRVLGIPQERTIDLNPVYGNIQAPSVAVNIYHAALAGKIKNGDIVLAYSFGGVSNAAATVMRWGDVALGVPPARPKSLSLQG